VTFEEFDQAARALVAVTVDTPFGPFPVYKVGGRMFALQIEGRASVKVTDIAFEVLTEEGRAIPAPYMQRAKWVQFEDLAVVDAAEMADWLKTAHALAAAKLTRKARAELGL
jgi:predicted DNA-binding protein (MmcQ/YjbR family)